MSTCSEPSQNRQLYCGILESWERKANLAQILTRLGKWRWRMPLILVRAAILGLLMPALDDPKADRDIFLKILTLDDAGTLGRWMRTRRFTDVDLESLSLPQEVQRWRELAAR